MKVLVLELSIRWALEVPTIRSNYMTTTHHNPAMEYSIWTMHSQNPCIFTDNKAEVAMYLQNRTGTTTEEEIDLVFTDIIHWLNKRRPAGSVRGSPLRHADVSAVVADSSSTASKREPDLALEFKLNDSDQQKKLATSTR
jgi:hypothetical protein